MVNVTVLTGWKLGTGPCGYLCMVGQKTSVLMHQIATNLDKDYFGQWGTEEEFQGQAPKKSDITHTVNDIINQYVIDINRRENWELELGTFTIPIRDHLQYIDIKYFGNNMTRLTVQTGIAHSYMQMKINKPWTRSDTGSPNRSPITDSRPFMRLALGRHYRLRIPTVDPDQDYVTCRTPVFVEFLELYRSKAPNVTVNKNCTIEIYTDPLNYKTGDTALVGIVVQDYPRKQIHLGKSSFYLNPYRQSLGQSPVQFTFKIADEDDSPVFLYPPSPPDGQVFSMYQGANLTIEVFAKPSGINKSVTNFRYISDSMANYLTQSRIHDRGDIGPSVRSQLISWVPRADMTGIYSLCVVAEDSEGFESESNYCFSIEVKEYPTTTGELTPRPGVPRFVNFPQTNEFNFPVDSLGLFPIYAGSATGRSKLNAKLTNVSSQDTMISAIDNDSDITKVTIQTTSSSGGKKDVCFQISDDFSSLERCTNIHFLTADPCERTPCKNGGVCVRTDRDDKFMCQCSGGYHGSVCELAPENSCASINCNGGHCFVLPGLGYKCLCPLGKTGTFCDHDINHCRVDSCVNGVCEDRQGNFICQCAEGFTGERCTGSDNSTVLCPGLRPNITGCTKQCNWCFEPHGICRPGNGVGQYDECTCALGYDHPATHCQRDGDITASGDYGPKVVPPTPGPKSSINCDMDETFAKKCSFPVYTKSRNIDRFALIVENVFATKNLRVTVSASRTTGISNLLMYVINVQQSEENQNNQNTYSVCLKVSSMGNVTDGTCVTVNFVMIAMPVYTSVKYRMFVEPTLPQNSEFTCRTGKACHILLYTEADNDHCERIISGKHSHVEVFSPKLLNGSCVTDVAFRPITMLYQRTCFRAGLGGESRCFGMILDSDPDTCRDSSCDNGGICVLRAGSHYCICQQNYFGTDCQSYKGEIEDIHESMTQLAIFYPGAFPINVTCFVNSRCFMNVFFTSKNSSNFSVSPGYTDAIYDELSAYVPENTALGRTGGVHIGVLMIRPTQAGHGRACIQIRNEMEGSIDERCFTLNIQNGHTTIGSKLFPYFVTPTSPNNTIYECTLGSDCRIMIWTHKADADLQCPEVGVLSHRPNTIGIKLIQNMTTSCVMDVIMNAHDVNETTDLCLKLRSKHIEDAISKRGTGEERCYSVSVSVNTTVTSPCASVQCYNGGYCDSRKDMANCLCPLGFSGQFCEQLHPGYHMQPNADRHIRFADDAFPSNIVCVVDEKCSFIMDLWGPDKFIPIVWFDHIDDSFITERPISNPDTAILPGIYSVLITVNGTKVGTFETILQTSDETGLVSDELWFRYEIIAGSTVTINENQPHFISPSFPPESTIKCFNERLCHIVLLSEAAAFYQCPHVEFLSKPQDSAYIFQEKNNMTHEHAFGGCMTDVVLLATDKKLSNEHFCFRLSLPTVPGETRCYRILYGSAALQN